MPSTLGIVQHTESFAEALKDLAEEAGIDRVEVVEGPDGVSEMSLDGLVVSVGGSEDVAPGLIRELVPRTSAPVVVVGADADHHLAAALVREGARELYVLPQDVGMLRGWLEERAERAREAESSAALRRAEAQQYAFDGIIGDSPGLKQALARVARIIPRDGVTVLITGETGTGKELVAQALHYNGPRGAGPFVEVNCAALPASLLEAELFGYEKGAFTDARTAKPGLFEAA
ncbi:MAG: sigma 54-interacting transcriptional regulator, partial [Gemmatimonadetes bacterium]|nr:sigma 54-interacting transcriptional regulator [Gemmatimonadota bacterium]